jgi:hypothetical protein
MKRSLAALAVGASLAAVSAIAIAGGVPKIVEIDSLTNLYAPVEFDHALHEDTADSCRTCHHEPFGKPLACADCHEEAHPPESFDHEKHWEYDSCDSCHQAEAADKLVCRGCHKTPFDEENLAVIGLKGAYHVQCMGCHEENGVDNDCATCHQRR